MKRGKRVYDNGRYAVEEVLNDESEVIGYRVTDRNGTSFLVNDVFPTQEEAIDFLEKNYPTDDDHEHAGPR